MTHDIKQYGLSNNFSSLYPILDGSQYPDDSFSEIPYEKGFQLLSYIESLIGNVTMQELLRMHIARNSLNSINYTVFQNEFEEIVNMKMSNPDKIIAQMNWTAWVHGPGMPPVV